MPAAHTELLTVPLMTSTHICSDVPQRSQLGRHVHRSVLGLEALHIAITDVPLAVPDTALNGVLPDADVLLALTGRPGNRVEARSVQGCMRPARFCIAVMIGLASVAACGSVDEVSGEPDAGSPSSDGPTSSSPPEQQVAVDSSAAPSTTPSLGDPTASSTTTRESDAPLDLAGPVWWLRDVLVDGSQPSDLADLSLDRAYIQFVEDLPCDDCPDGTKMVGNDACNSFARAVTVEPGVVTAGPWGESTLVGCSGPFYDAVGEVLWGDSFEYAVSGDALHLTSSSGSVELILRTDSAPLGPASAEPIRKGQVGDAEFRVTWTNGGLGLEWRDRSNQAFQPSTAGVGANPDGTTNAMRVDVGGEQFLLGVVPADAERAEYLPSGGQPVELSLIDVSDPASRVIAEVVPGSADRWSIITYGRDGSEINRFNW